MTISNNELPKAIGDFIFKFNQLTATQRRYSGSTPARFISDLVGEATHYILTAKDAREPQNTQLVSDMGYIIGELPHPMPTQLSEHQQTRINHYAKGGHAESYKTGEVIEVFEKGIWKIGKILRIQPDQTSTECIYIIEGSDFQVEIKASEADSLLRREFKYL